MWGPGAISPFDLQTAKLPTCAKTVKTCKNSQTVKNCKNAKNCQKHQKHQILPNCHFCQKAQYFQGMTPRCYQDPLWARSYNQCPSVVCGSSQPRRGHVASPGLPRFLQCSPARSGPRSLAQPSSACPGPRGLDQLFS